MPEPPDPADLRLPLTEEGMPELAAFELYHDHRMDLTSRNIWRGLEGMFIVHDRREH